MKKILLITIVALLSFNNSQAQLPDGSIAPDWTLTDLNGTTHRLYDYLDQGYTVFIDFSAVWCPPCWSYHTSGALEDLYINHGPSGMSNVSTTTTDNVMVFFIEGDEGSLADLNGGSGSQGDWVTGTPYPIIPTYPGTNSPQISSQYQVPGWPTIYMVCPDRLITETGQSSNPYSFVNSCPPPASNDNDARAMDYSGETLTCEGDLTPEITIQNYGFSSLTSLTIEVSVNGNVVSTTPWSGNLTTYGTDNITLPGLTGLSGGESIAINVSSPNGGVDANLGNNGTTFYVTMATQNTNAYVTVQIITDAYGSETTWNIKDNNGATVLSGGPYNDLSATGTTPQTPVSGILATQMCHTFTINDSYGDGINSGYGVGSFTVTDGNGTVLASGGQFSDTDGDAFKTGSESTPPVTWDCDSQGNCSDPGTGAGQYNSLGECNALCTATSVNDVISQLNIYPNPVKDALTIEGTYTSIDIFDVFGKLVLSSEYSKRINVSSLADGIYMLNITTEKEIQTQRITITK